MQAIPRFAERGTPRIPNNGRTAIWVKAPMIIPDTTLTVVSYADDFALCKLRCSPYETVGGPGGIRTHYLRLMRSLLIPHELLARCCLHHTTLFSNPMSSARWIRELNIAPSIAYSTITRCNNGKGGRLVSD